METKQGILDVNKLEKGITINGFFTISALLEGVATNGQPYLTLKLKNKSGEIEAKLWSVSEEQKNLCKNEKMIKIRALVGDYKGSLQLTINLVRAVNEEDGIELDDLLQAAPINKQKVDDEIIKTILEFKNEEVKQIVLRIYKKHQQKFLVHVAAKSNHHNLLGGLAYHTSTMLEIAKRIAPLYPAVNTDYLYATIILHDIMKTVELSDDVVAPSYTVEGFLLGHITMITSEIKVVTEELIKEGIIQPDSLVPSVLASNCASHHGKGEWGSPVEPRTIEAELVHHIDMIDSRMYMIGHVIEGAEKGTMVRVPAMRRDFYVHS